MENKTLIKNTGTFDVRDKSYIITVELQEIPKKKENILSSGEELKKAFSDIYGKKKIKPTYEVSMNLHKLSKNLHGLCIQVA